MSDQRVRVDETLLYAYPDVTVYCGEPAYSSTNPPSLLNPAIVIEVLSETTEEYDRGAKFAHFRHVPTLREYVLVDWRERRVEHYRKIDQSNWHLTTYEGGAREVAFPSLDLSIPLADIFDGIDAVMPRPA
jgi:Uma2 family endonuclease